MKRSEKAVILIVDDKPANVIALESLLVSADRLLISANSGKDALKIAIERKIDLIILDVQMPEMDGFEVAQILNSNKKTRDIPIIFASAEKKEHASMMKGYEEGAIDYLSKPLDPEITKAKVSVFLKVQLQKKGVVRLLDNGSQVVADPFPLLDHRNIAGVYKPLIVLHHDVPVKPFDSPAFGIDTGFK